MTKTFTIRGIKMRTASQRRFIVVRARATSFVGTRRVWDYKTESYSERVETFVAFTEIVRRSDSVEVARKVARETSAAHGAFVAVVDTTTGEEV